MQRDRHSKQKTLTAKIGLVKLVLPQWILACFISFVVASAYALASPLLTKVLIDRGIMHHNIPLFTYAIIAIGLISVCIRLIGAWLGVYQTRLANRCVTTMSHTLLERFYATRYDRASSIKSTYLTSRMFDEVVSASQFICGPLMVWLVAVLTFVLSLSTALWLSWRATVALIVIIPPLCIAARRSKPHIQNASERVLESEANYKNTLAQALRAHQTVLRYQLSDRIRERLARELRHVLELLTSQVIVVKRNEAFSSIAMSIAELAVTVACAIGVLHGTMTIGGLIAYLAVFWRAVEHGTTVIQSYSSLLVSSRQLDRLLEMEGLNSIGPDCRRALTEERHSAYLKNVRVAVGEAVWIKYAHFEIGANERVVLHGPNGSGKSTLMHALSGDAQIVCADRFEVAATISGLILPFHFMPGSLLDHLHLDRMPKNRIEMFWEMVTEAGLSDRVRAEDVELWSAGERQKAQLILALTPQASLYVLDEPFSNLDKDAREWAVRWILAATKGAALLLITHDIQLTDQIADRYSSMEGFAMKESSATAALV